MSSNEETIRLVLYQYCNARILRQITTMEAKLSKLRDGSILVTPEEKKGVEESYTLKVGLWRKRKRMFKELWDMMSEAMPANSKEFRVLTEHSAQFNRLSPTFN